MDIPDIEFKVQIVETVVTTYKVRAKDTYEAMAKGERMHTDGDQYDEMEVTDRFTNVI